MYCLLVLCFIATATILVALGTANNLLANKLFRLALGCSSDEVFRIGTTRQSQSLASCMYPPLYLVYESILSIFEINYLGVSLVKPGVWRQSVCGCGDSKTGCGNSNPLSAEEGSGVMQILIAIRIDGQSSQEPQDRPRGT
jgi:hypothetical protein